MASFLTSIGDSSLQNLKEIRQSLGLSQKDFAEAAGVSHRTVQSLESGGVISKRSRRIILAYLQSKGGEGKSSHLHPRHFLESQRTFLDASAREGSESVIWAINHESLPALADQGKQGDMFRSEWASNLLKGITYKVPILLTSDNAKYRGAIEEKIFQIVSEAERMKQGSSKEALGKIVIYFFYFDEAAAKLGNYTVIPALQSKEMVEIHDFPKVPFTESAEDNRIIRHQICDNLLLNLLALTEPGASHIIYTTQPKNGPTHIKVVRETRGAGNLVDPYNESPQTADDMIVHIIGSGSLSLIFNYFSQLENNINQFIIKFDQ